MIGPIGALLAVPLTLLMKALLLDADPNTRWISSLLEGGPPPPEDDDADDDDTSDHAIRGAPGPHRSGRGRAGTPFRGTEAKLD